MSLYVINDESKLTTVLYGQHKIYCGCSVNYIHDRPVVRFQLYWLYVCALRDVRTYIYIYIYIYIKHIYIYIYIYMTKIFRRCKISVGLAQARPNKHL